MLIARTSLGVVLAGAAGACGQHTIVPLMNSTGPYSSFSTPVRNNAGQIAFRAVIDNGPEGIFRGPNPATDTFVTTANGFSGFGAIDINEGGVIAFHALRANFGPPGVFTGPDPVADSEVNNRTFSAIRAVSINDAGVIGFGAVYGAPHTINPFREREGAYRAEGGVATTIAENTLNAPGTYFNVDTRSVVINNQGTVAFYGRPQDGGRGIYSGPDPATSALITSDGPYEDFSSWMDLDDSGGLAFVAREDGQFPKGVYRGPNPATDRVALEGAEFLSFGPVDRNNAGAVAFGAFMAGGGQAIYAAPAGAGAQRVIGTGDSLFGGVVQQAFMARGGFNDLGEIAFHYILTNGITGIAVAEPTGGGCYANCDASTASPVLNVADFTCFLQRFAAGESYANCDASTSPPVLNVADFTCFLQSFAAGCP